MSKPPDGGNPPGEVHARKKGKRRRPGKKNNGNPPLHGRNDLAARSGDAPADNDRRGIVAGQHDTVNESAERSGDNRQLRPQESLAAPGDPLNPRNNRKRRRRRGRRGANSVGAGHFGDPPGKNQANENNAARHMRSPVTPAGPAAFDEAKAARSAGKSGYKQRRGTPSEGQRRDRTPANGKDRQHKPGRGRYGNRLRPRANTGAHHRQPAFAALDLGTNNCRLLIAVPQDHGRFKVIDAFSRIVRLGQGLGHSGRLADDAMERAIAALSVCASKLASHKIAGKRLIATEACRRAANGAHFLSEVKRRTGLELEIVDRETEARLAAEGCGTLMDRGAEGAVLFDIGGGSSELILINRKLAPGRQLSSQIAGWTSLPLGVVTLSERHGGKHVTRNSYDAMVAEVLGHLDQFDGRDRLAEIWGRGSTHLLGTSGTVTTIAGVHLRLPRYDRRKVDGTWLSDGQIDRVIDDLLEMDYETRALNPCIGRDRADLVLAGCAILQAIRVTWPSPRLRVADRGLREGILNELMMAAGVWASAPNGDPDGLPELPETQHRDPIPRES